jgi:hypothetical protein
MPFEIRMNMFLIKCSELNNQLCDECDEIMKMLLDKIENFVYQNLSQQITAKVKKIKEDLANKANDSKTLVKFEQLLENVKSVQRH